MNEQRIREIASQCSDFAEQIPYFRGIEDGLTWEAKIQKARDLKFAELIVGECLSVMDATAKESQENFTYLDNDVPTTAHQYEIRKHFGVGE